MYNYNFCGFPNFANGSTTDNLLEEKVVFFAYFRLGKVRIRRAP